MHQYRYSLHGMHTAYIRHAHGMHTAGTLHAHGIDNKTNVATNLPIFYSR